MNRGLTKSNNVANESQWDLDNKTIATIGSVFAEIKKEQANRLQKEGRSDAFWISP